MRSRGTGAFAIVAALLTPSLRGAQPTAPVVPPVMTYIYHPPESATDVRYVYQWEVLRMALEATRKAWGPYRMVAARQMTESRQAHEMINATGRLTVMYLSTVPRFEAELVPVRIPVDRNLGGYCVFLVREEQLPRLASVNTLEDLKRFSYGLGLGWIDVEILRSSGFTVVTGSSYDGLFEMLAHRRFQIFLRAAVEVLDEYESHRADMPQLHIEDHLVLYYPLPMYFWFPRTAEGRRLAARAEQGMRRMIADGSYDRVFDKYQRWKIERLRLKDRKILRIENPFVGPETPFADKRLWFDPATYH